MIASGGVSGGFSSMIAGGNFMDGFRQGIITAGLNHVAHLTVISLYNGPGKFVVAGIYGAGGDEASGNPDLKALVEGQGGKMFTSSWGTNDQEIIDYLLAGYKEGKQIKIYGYSRGGTAAVRIANALGDMYIPVAEINLYDPVTLYGGGGLIFNHPYVMKVNNYYQRNPTDHLSSAMNFKLANNPFKGSPVSAKFQWPVINNVNLTGKYYNGSVNQPYKYNRICYQKSLNLKY